MANNIPVSGHAHLSRSSTVHGAVINTNETGFKAFKEAQKRARRLEDVEDELNFLRQAVDQLINGK